MACSNKVTDSVNAIVWEYESDIPGLFLALKDKTSNYIEEQYSKRPQNLIFSLSDLDHLLANYNIDLNAMTQTNARGKVRKLQRKLYDSVSTTIGSGVIWQWKTEKGWNAYNTEAVEAIEAAYIQNKPTCDLQALNCGLPNEVFITKGYQKNKSSGFIRPTRRKCVAYKTDAPTAPSVKERSPRQKVGVGHSVKRRTESGNNLVTNKDDLKSSASASSVSVNLRNDHMLHDFCVLCKDVPAKEDCAICLSSLKEDNQAATLSEDVFQLRICKHMFHESCLEALYKQAHNQNKCLKCPICKQIHGTLLGDQPRGRMTHRIDMNQSVAGYEGDGMIIVTYDFRSGIQGPEHPNPGQSYTAVGFPRTAYLPANKKGKLVLALLKIAFDRKLIFTVGTSSTSGSDNTVTWTTVHHKTSPRDQGSGHGYPDPGYLDNVIDELKGNGVTENDVS